MEHTFQVKTVYDMLLKLDWEIEQLQRSHISKSADKLSMSSYFAINGALTAFHICDWIWHGGSDSQREIWGGGQAAKHMTKFQLGLRAACPSLNVCREIATSFKHYAEGRFPDKTVKSATIWFTAMAATCGTARAGDALSADAAILRVSYGAETVPVAHILSLAYGFLEDFCESHGLLLKSDV